LPIQRLCCDPHCWQIKTVRVFAKVDILHRVVLDFSWWAVFRAPRGKQPANDLLPQAEYARIGVSA
jgi:hypothetical protein